MRTYALTDMGPFGTNCYIIDCGNGEAMLIDAPYSAGQIDKALAGKLIPKKILLTHGHCDHIEALNGLCDKYGCEVYISEHDKPMLESAELCKASYFGTPFEPFSGAKTISDGDVITLGDVTLRVIATPGHTKGSVCYCSDNIIFTGDTLFCESVGRTDLGSGDREELISSIEKLYALGKNYVIYPGHGFDSDLNDELRHNPYLENLRQKL